MTKPLFTAKRIANNIEQTFWHIHVYNVEHKSVKSLVCNANHASGLMDADRFRI